MRIKTYYFVLAILTFCAGPAASQEADTTGTEHDVYLSKKGLNNLLNSKLSSIVTGQTNGSLIGNYASLDPAAGSFTFKGSFGVGQRDTMAKISYLSFKIQGDLISESYSALFKNTKLNTGSVLDVQYHFRLAKGSGIKFLETDRVSLSLQKVVDSNQLKEGNRILLIDEKNRSEVLKIHQTKLQLDSAELAVNHKALDSVIAIRDRARAPVQYATLKKANTYADSILTVIVMLQKDSLSLIYKIDSIKYVSNNAFYFRQEKKGKNNIAYQNKLKMLELNARVSSLSISWLTITGGISKKNFYTYTPSAGFSQSIEKKELGTFRAGLTVNYYKQFEYPFRGSFLINLGFLRFSDNNTSLLSTQDIEQAVVTKNAGGDTTRTISKKYSVYTDPITKSQVWSLFTNFYLISPNNSSAFHVYPSYDIYDAEKDLLNIGVGYIISFKNLKKDSPVINAEGYIQFQDVTDNHDTGLKFWQRNEIGIRFTLPFNFF